MAGAGTVRIGMRLAKRLRGLLDDVPPDAIDLTGYHYGNAPNLYSLSGSNYGLGSRGREADRLSLTKDPRINKRVYFYGDRGDGLIPRSEPVVYGPHIYRSDLSGLYLPGQSDPAVLRAARSEGQFDANTFEEELLRTGYLGYYNSGTNQAVTLGVDEVPVDYLGTRLDLTPRIRKGF